MGCFSLVQRKLLKYPHKLIKTEHIAVENGNKKKTNICLQEYHEAALFCK